MSQHLKFISPFSKPDAINIAIIKHTVIYLGKGLEGHECMVTVGKKITLILQIVHRMNGNNEIRQYYYY